LSVIELSTVGASEAGSVVTVGLKGVVVSWAAEELVRRWLLTFCQSVVFGFFPSGDGMEEGMRRAELESESGVG